MYEVSKYHGLEGSLLRIKEVLQAVDKFQDNTNLDFIQWIGRINNLNYQHRWELMPIIAENLAIMEAKEQEERQAEYQEYLKRKEQEKEEEKLEWTRGQIIN